MLAVIGCQDNSQLKVERHMSISEFIPVDHAFVYQYWGPLMADQNVSRGKRSINILSESDREIYLLETLLDLSIVPIGEIADSNERDAGRKSLRRIVSQDHELGYSVSVLKIWNTSENQEKSLGCVIVSKPDKWCVVYVNGSEVVRGRSNIDLYAILGLMRDE